MAVMPVQPPKFKPLAGSTGVPRMRHFPPNQGSGGAKFAIWPDSMLLKQVTTGTITPPNPNGSLSAFPGPIVINETGQTSVLTVTFSASSGAPAQTYWPAFSYGGAAAIESQISPASPVACAAGFVPVFSISSSGAPAGATTFYTYCGLFPRQWYRQGTATNLGSTNTLAYPLANFLGVGPVAAGDSSSIVGFASSASDMIFDTLGQVAPDRRQPYGPTVSTSPLQSLNSVYPVEDANPNAGIWELNLIQSLVDPPNGIAVGINIDATTGLPVWDTTQTQVATLYAHQNGQYQGVAGDTYARVYGQFLSTVVI